MAPRKTSMTRLSSDISNTPEIGCPVSARANTSAVMPNIRNRRKNIAIAPKTSETRFRSFLILSIERSFGTTATENRLQVLADLVRAEQCAFRIVPGDGFGHDRLHLLAIDTGLRRNALDPVVDLRRLNEFARPLLFLLRDRVRRHSLCLCRLHVPGEHVLVDLGELAAIELSHDLI